MRELTVPVLTETILELSTMVPCAWCKAGEGDQCVDQDKQPLTNLVHAPRMVTFCTIYRIGYQHGRRSMKGIT